MPPEIPPPTPASTPTTMRAIVLIGHGGPEMLQLRHDVPVPKPHSDQVLIQVLAAGINNTDVNTRIGWYAKGYGDGGEASGWAGGLQFPRIQGADACGRIVAVGDGVSTQRIGERVIVATMQQDPTGTPFSTVTLGSEMDGAFAEYLVARSSETFAVSSDWSDAELASVPCAMSTAENLLRRVQLTAGERVLITGASGGVGTAAVQLARARGALVAAVAQGSKREALVQLGAHEVIDRDASLLDVITAESVDVVVDVVGGPSWPLLLDVLRRGGRYVTSGAIAGPMVELDLRTLYLKDLTLLGATYQEPDVLPSVIAHIEQGRIRPLVHATYPLADIAAAQTAFLAKDFVGKLVLIP
jgi:NADPH:quinone reductase-like Zn-dependent oxidoreductase